jgi:hypothetical protein
VISHKPPPFCNVLLDIIRNPWLSDSNLEDIYQVPRAILNEFIKTYFTDLLRKTRNAVDQMLREHHKSNDRNDLVFYLEKVQKTISRIYGKYLGWNNRSSSASSQYFMLGFTTSKFTCDDQAPFSLPDPEQNDFETDLEANEKKFQFLNSEKENLMDDSYNRYADRYTKVCSLTELQAIKLVHGSDNSPNKKRFRKKRASLVDVYSAWLEVLEIPDRAKFERQSISSFLPDFTSYNVECLLQKHSIPGETKTMIFFPPPGEYFSKNHNATLSRYDDVEVQVPLLPGIICARTFYWESMYSGSALPLGFKLGNLGWNVILLSPCSNSESARFVLQELFERGIIENSPTTKNYFVSCGTSILAPLCQANPNLFCGGVIWGESFGGFAIKELGKRVLTLPTNYVWEKVVHLYFQNSRCKLTHSNPQEPNQQPKQIQSRAEVMYNTTVFLLWMLTAS